MKTNDELNDMARRIYLEYDSDELPAARKLLHSVEVAALREAREIVERNESVEYVEYSSLGQLDRLIRGLELQ